MGLTQIFTNAWGKELCQLPLLVTICKLPLNYTLVVDQRSMKRGYARRLDGELLVRKTLACVRNTLPDFLPPFCYRPVLEQG